MPFALAMSLAISPDALPLPPIEDNIADRPRKRQMSGECPPLAKAVSSDVEPINKNIQSDFLTPRDRPRNKVHLSSSRLNYSRPNGLNLVPLGTCWSLDIFARLNNGCRRSFIDLYTMIDAMQGRVNELRTSDLKLFFHWWQLFASFLTMSLEAYHNLLLPWVSEGDQDASLPESVSTERLNAMRKSLDTVLSVFDTMQAKMTRRPPDETMAGIIKGVMDVPPITEFFAAVENQLPDLVELHYEEDDVTKINRKLAFFMQKNGVPSFRRFHLLVLARGMTMDELTVWQRYLAPILRVACRVHGTKYNSSFLSVVHTLAAI